MPAIELDTIAAIATAPGRSGIGILRVSGSAAVQSIAWSITGRHFEPRRATLASFFNAQGDLIDRGLALFFPPPGSYTGDFVLEFHTHGSPIILDLLLARVLELGARLARPGEFTERAFLNGKLDLTQAEAVADLISSTNETQAKLAARTLQGALSEPIQALQTELMHCRVELEAGLDFPDEDIELADDKRLSSNIQKLHNQIETLIHASHQGACVRDGLKIVIAGPPNAGKSSLLNQLSGESAAIVSDIPGTTRDLIRSSIHLDGMPLHLVDTAGMRSSADAIEREGMRRAQQEMTQADFVLWVYDVVKGAPPTPEELRQFTHENPIVLVGNKIDLLPEADKHVAANFDLINSGVVQTEFAISAKTGTGLTQLKEFLKKSAGYQDASETGFITRRRHLLALEQARDYLFQALNHCGNSWPVELIAEDLRLAQTQLSMLTGEISSEDLLGEIFAGFCIGK